MDQFPNRSGFRQVAMVMSESAHPTHDEATRIKALRQYAVLDTLPERALDDLTGLAAQICGVPIALISLVDERRQWFKARVGLEMCEMPRDEAFCAHTILQRDLFMVRDATLDERFAQFPLVAGPVGVRFYAGAPVVNPDGEALGALCVMDRVPRTLTPDQGRALRVLARQVMTHLELRRHTRALREREERLQIFADDARLAEIASLRLAAIVEFSDDAIIGKDLNSIVTSWNKGAEKIFGYTAGEMVGASIMRLIPADRADEEIQILAAIRRGESVQHFETLRRTKDGRLIHVSVTASPIKDAMGGVIGVSKTARDISERVKAEEARRAVEARYRTLFEYAPDGIVIADPAGRYLEVNARLCRMLEYDRSELIGRHAADIVAPDEIPQIEPALDAIKGESGYQREWRFRRKGGSVFRAEVMATLMPDGNLLAIIRDSTDRKRAEEQLQWKTAFFEAQVNSALDGILIVDSNGKTVLQNQRMLELWNYPGDIASDPDVQRRLDWVATQVVDPRSFTEYVAHLKSHPQAITHDELELVDGRVFDRYSAPVLGQDGKQYGRILSFRDVTERKRAQEQIAEQAAFLDKARDAILVRDLEGKILFWNEGARRMYGWTREETVGRNIGGLLYRDLKKFTEANALTVSEGEWHGELQHLAKDQHEITIEARWTLIRDNEGHPKSVLAINTDITEKKKIEAQFLRAQRMESIGTLAGGIAHDLNNILAPIMMSIEILKASTASDPRAAKILGSIEVSAKRGADIVRQVLSFARGLEGERIEVQPKHLLQDLKGIIESTFPKDIRLQFSVPSGIWTILGDPTQVHQILLNLCVNARDAMPTGGSLTVGVENCVLDDNPAINVQAKPGRYVNICVTDSGTGIPAEILDKIFEPFFTTKELNKGTGLGLSTVMAIVKSHEGIINVYSEPGKGTTFRVYLPAMEISTEARKEQSKEASLPRGDGETVLVVDDEASILTITSQTLQAFGYRVLTATDGADALGIYLQYKDDIAVVLTDMMMPVMDGPAMIHALVRINPAIKIIAASGLKANSGAATESGTGVKHFLTKPYTAGTLLKKLRMILDEA